MTIRDHPNWTASKVWKYLDAWLDERDGGASPLPHEKTIQRRRAAIQSEPAPDPDDLAPWSVTDGDGDVVLPTLLLGLGRPSRGQARVIAQVRRACPTLTNEPEHLDWAWHLAAFLRDRRADNALLLMAYAPWEDEGARLREAVRTRQVPWGVAALGGYFDFIPDPIPAKEKR